MWHDGKSHKRENFESTTLQERIRSWRSTVCTGPCIEDTSTPSGRQSHEEHTGNLFCADDDFQKYTSLMWCRSSSQHRNLSRPRPNLQDNFLPHVVVLMIVLKIDIKCSVVFTLHARKFQTSSGRCTSSRGLGPDPPFHRRPSARPCRPSSCSLPRSLPRWASGCRQLR